MRQVAIALSLFFIPLFLVNCKPTLYKINDNDKLEPVMVPVSSTVIPLPVYKVSTNVEVGTKEHKSGKPGEPTKLITVSKKKVSPKTDDVNIKEISKDEYEALVDG